MVLLPQDPAMAPRPPKLKVCTVIISPLVIRSLAPLVILKFPVTGSFEPNTSNPSEITIPPLPVFSWLLIVVVFVFDLINEFTTKLLEPDMVPLELVLITPVTVTFPPKEIFPDNQFSC